MGSITGNLRLLSPPQGAPARPQSAFGRLEKDLNGHGEGLGRGAEKWDLSKRVIPILRARPDYPRG